ncbi:hypothetical protein N2152v2_003453 [Parachlorella kessleri]
MEFELLVYEEAIAGRQDAYVAEAALLVRIDTPSASRQQQPLPTLGDSDTEDLLAAHCWAPGTGRSMFVDEGYAVSLRSVDTKLVMLQGHQRAGGMHVSVVS